MTVSSQTKRIVLCVATLGLGAAARGLGSLDLPSILAALVTAVLAVTGILTTLLVPGLVYLPLVRRLKLVRKKSQAFYYLLFAMLITVASHVVVQKLGVLLGGSAGFWVMLGGAGAFTLLGALLSARRGRHVQLLWPEPFVLRSTLAGGAVLVLFSLVTTPPRLVDETDYMSEQLYQVASRLRFSPTPSGVSLAPGPAWRRRGTRLVLRGRAGTIKLTNGASGAAALPLKLLVKNGTRGDLMLRVWLDDRLVGGKELVPYDKGDLDVSGLTAADSVRLPARFNHRREPRNTPTPNVLLTPTLRLAPGQHILRLVFAPADGRVTKGDVSLVDLSGLDGRQFYRALTGQVFIGDTGDIQETLDLSRNFRWHWIQHSSSFDGGIFDGGGPTSVSDEPPGHHFFCFLALTFMGDSITSISLLWLVWLVLLLWVTILLSTDENPTSRWWHLLPLMMAALVYTRLCRLGLESNAPDTLYLLAWMCVLKVYWDQRENLGLLLAALAFLVHVTTPQCLVMMAVAYYFASNFASKNRLVGPWFAVKALAVLVLLIVARVGIVSLDAGFEAALYSGQNDFLASNRLSAVKAILTGDLSRIPGVLSKAAVFFPQAMAATCGVLLVIPLTLLLPKDVRPKIAHHRGWTLFLFGVFYFLALSVVDVLRSHHLGPIIFPAMAGAARRLSQLRSPVHQKWPVAVMVAVGLATLGFLLVATPDVSGTFSDWYLGLWTLRNP